MNVVNTKSFTPERDLRFTSDVERKTAHLYQKVSKVIPEVEWPVFAPLIHRINQLKAEKNAVILGHNYMTPEIFHCVADITGDSLALARHAAETDADVIVMAG
ncbi:MAG: quinolinate synthase NadA, partial [Rhodospirillaceae bacterium]